MRCPCCASDYSFEEPCLCLPANYFAMVMTSAEVDRAWSDAGRQSSIRSRPNVAWLMAIGEA